MTLTSFFRPDAVPLLLRLPHVAVGAAAAAAVAAAHVQVQALLHQLFLPSHFLLRQRTLSLSILVGFQHKEPTGTRALYVRPNEAVTYEAATDSKRPRNS